MKPYFSKVLFFLSILLLLVNCKKENQVNNATSKDEVQNSNKISKSDIKNIKYVDYILSDQSLKAVSDWMKFQELQEEIEKLKNGELNFFKEDIVLLNTLYEELENTIPENLNNPEVTTRITVLKNNSFNLNSELNLDRNEKSYGINSIKELLVAASNLKLQINKKLEMDSQNIIKPQ